jgi:hypothetical protein
MQIAKLHQGILTKAFEGKLVPHHLTDGPTNEFLESIRQKKPVLIKGPVSD